MQGLGRHLWQLLAEVTLTMAQARKRKLKEKKAPELPVLNPTAAGIDIGATEIYVAVHPDPGDPEPRTLVRHFHRGPPSVSGLAQELPGELRRDGINRRLLDLRCSRSWKSVALKFAW